MPMQAESLMVYGLGSVKHWSILLVEFNLSLLYAGLDDQEIDRLKCCYWQCTRDGVRPRSIDDIGMPSSKVYWYDLMGE